MINVMGALATVMIVNQNNQRRRINEEEERRRARKVQPTFQSTLNKERNNQERKK